MHVTIVTAFPEFFGDFLSTSILGRAVKQGLVRVDLVDLRGFGRGGVSWISAPVRACQPPQACVSGVWRLPTCRRRHSSTLFCYKRRQINAIQIASRGPLLQTSSI